MNEGIKNYLENIRKPWGILFYRVLWEQLGDINGAKILDFGSGFGLTANHFAKNNEVIAIEPNQDMVEIRECENNYCQINGDINELKKQPDNSFDFVFCHNVLEYAKEREDIIKELSRVLKTDGIMSIVKHNHCGRIMHKVVFENNVDEALALLAGGSIVLSLGQVDCYSLDDISNWTYENDLCIEKVLGIRTFWGLQQNNEIKNDSKWQDKMFEIEMKVSNIDEYKNVSSFSHILLKKQS